jgi:putative oxidoreductase
MNAIVKIDIGLLILRVGFSGFLFLLGLEKLEVALSSNINYTDPIGLGPTLTLVLFTELICTVLVAVGYRVRWSSIPPIILMLVAVFIVHKNDSIMEKELAVLYLISFIVIGILGSGKYAIKK